AARARSLRSRCCPCQRSICGRRRKALPPTSPKRTRFSPAIIARERICVLHSTTRSRAIACWTRSRRQRQPVSVKRSVDPASSYEKYCSQLGSWKSSSASGIHYSNQIRRRRTVSEPSPQPETWPYEEGSQLNPGRRLSIISGNSVADDQFTLLTSFVSFKSSPLFSWPCYCRR